MIELVWMTVLSLQQSTSVALKTAEGSTTDLATEIENIVKEKMVSACGSHRAWFLPTLPLCMCKVSHFVSHQLTLCMEHSLAHGRICCTYSIQYFILVTAASWCLTSSTDYVQCLLWVFILLLLSAWHSSSIYVWGFLSGTS